MHMSFFTLNSAMSSTGEWHRVSIWHCITEAVTFASLPDLNCTRNFENEVILRAPLVSRCSQLVRVYITNMGKKNQLI